MPIPKIDPKKIFASQAPSQDVPAEFNNYERGWDESRKNNGKPTIKQFNKLQQLTDEKILWMHQNGAALPFDETMEYAEGAVVVKDGDLQQLKDGNWQTVKQKGMGELYQEGETYNIGDEVRLENSDRVYSIFDGNTNNPNSNMTGWIYANNKLNSVAQLRSIPEAMCSSIRAVTTLGYYAEGDSGGASYIWVFGSFNDDNGSVIKPSDSTGIGAWVFADKNPKHIKCWGAKGVEGEDDTLAFVNALSSGHKVFSDPTCYHEIQRIVISGQVDQPYFCYKKVSRSTSVSFDGGGCSIKVKGMVGEVLVYPANGTGLAGDIYPWAFDFSYIKSLNIHKFKLTGPLFDNIQEDTKPYIFGVQGTYRALNTMIGGILAFAVDNVKSSNIVAEKINKGLRIYRGSGHTTKNITIKKCNDGFTFTDTENCTHQFLKVEDARFQLAEARLGVNPSPGIIVDGNGNTLYTIVPDTSNNSGVKVSGGHSIVDAGGKGNTYIDCSSLRSKSDGFRTQQGVLNARAENIKTIRFISDYDTRWGVSVYGESFDIKHINPVVTNHGVLNYVEPPATREEALLGCTNGDIENYWTFNQYSDSSRTAAVMARSNGMEVINPTVVAGARPVYEPTKRYLKDVKHSIAYTYSLCILDTLNAGFKFDVFGGDVTHTNSDQYSSVVGIVAGSDPARLSEGEFNLHNVSIKAPTSVSFSDNIALRPVLLGIESYSIDVTMIGGSIESEHILAYNNLSGSGYFGGKVKFDNVSFSGETLFTNSNKAQAQNLINTTYNFCNFNTQPLLGRTLTGKFQNTRFNSCSKLVRAPVLTSAMVDLSNVVQFVDMGYEVLFPHSSTGTKIRIPVNSKFAKILAINRTFPETIPSGSQAKYDSIGYFGITKSIIKSTDTGTFAIAEIMNDSGVYYQINCTVNEVDSDFMNVTITATGTFQNKPILLRFESINMLDIA